MRPIEHLHFKDFPLLGTGLASTLGIAPRLIRELHERIRPRLMHYIVTHPLPEQRVLSLEILPAPLKRPK